MLCSQYLAVLTYQYQSNYVSGSLTHQYQSKYVSGKPQHISIKVIVYLVALTYQYQSNYVSGSPDISVSK